MEKVVELIKEGGLVVALEVGLEKADDWRVEWEEDLAKVVELEETGGGSRGGFGDGGGGGGCGGAGSGFGTGGGFGGGRVGHN